MRRPQAYNRHVQAIIAKSVRLGLDVPIVVVRDRLTEAQAFETERAFIAAIGRNNLANLTDGGEGAAGAKRTAAWRAMMSNLSKGNKWNLGIKRSDEFRATMRQIHRNRSDETLEKMAAANRLRALSSEHFAQLKAASSVSAMKRRGKPLNPEHAAKIGAGNLGLKRSPETRKKMSEAQKGNKKGLGHVHSAEARTKMSVAAKARERAKAEKRHQHQLSLDLD